MLLQGTLGALLDVFERGVCDYRLSLALETNILHHARKTDNDSSAENHANSPSLVLIAPCCSSCMLQQASMIPSGTHLKQMVAAPERKESWSLYPRMP